MTNYDRETSSRDSDDRDLRGRVQVLFPLGSVVHVGTSNDRKRVRARCGDEVSVHKGLGQKWVCDAHVKCVVDHLRSEPTLQELSLPELEQFHLLSKGLQSILCLGF